MLTDATRPVMNILNHNVGMLQRMLRLQHKLFVDLGVVRLFAEHALVIIVSTVHPNGGLGIFTTRTAHKVVSVH